MPTSPCKQKIQFEEVGRPLNKKEQQIAVNQTHDEYRDFIKNFRTNWDKSTQNNQTEYQIVNAIKKQRAEKAKYWNPNSKII